ncbi:LysR family transcriptional regulator [Paenibacillus sp. DXFW5]|uniref:LysR family transcriptional regulator n=1 Tax=Paenibacillus rhizolycopersici TaxID=2780073 RepID=A0ABS2H4K6_9BACL|nr:LysR family transcriptional regulator [Paenibacillus rhizolycopersici]MBM6995308.1 LysR family transcriptional regulator [Paenibacillus rhizolycopersici]
MELRQLECFKAVCQELHFTKAAERLNISQPTLSYQIKLLEDELSVPLFNRIGKKITMTPAGHILHKYSAAIFNSLAGVREEISELHHLERGELAVAALIGELNELVSGLLGEFYPRHPRLQLKLLGVEDVIEYLVSEEADFAVTILPQEEDERFAAIPLYKEDFYFVAPAAHPLAGQTSIDFERIVEEAVVMFPPTHRCRQLVDATCAVKGFTLQPQIETTTIDSLLRLIRSGAGVTILSKTLLDMYDLRDLCQLPLRNPCLTREVGIVHLKDKYLGAAAREFIALIQERVRTLKEI